MIAQTPPMGFNTWNTFGEGFNEELLCEIADAMVERGFRDAGYQYLIVDDHWSLEERDPETGRMIPRPRKFPNGIKPVIDYVHSKGLKFGIYSCAGVKTCGQKVGSFDHEFIDAKTLAEWEVDYLKYDYCLKPEKMNGEVLYRRMGLALRHSGREILFAACNWGQDDVWSWIRSAGAHMYRSTYDIFDNFQSVNDIFRSQIPKLGSSAPYCFNDLDMLTVGMSGEGNASAGSTCTEGEYRIQFCVWCMFSAPLILGCDLRTVDDKYRDLLCNSELIKINQDIEARPAFPIGCDDRSVFCKFLSDGEYALLYINMDDHDHNMAFIAYDIGLTTNSGYKLQLTDVFTGKVEGVFSDFVDVPVSSHDCRLFRAKLIRD